MAPVAKANVYKVNTNFYILRTQAGTTNDTMENTMGNGLMSDLHAQTTKIESEQFDKDSYVCDHSEDDSCDAWAMDVAHTASQKQVCEG